MSIRVSLYVHWGDYLDDQSCHSRAPMSAASSKRRRLTDDEVRMIYEADLSKYGGRSQVARKFGVTNSAVSKIRRRLIRGRVTEGLTRGRDAVQALPLGERFQHYVSVAADDECWVWRGTVGRDGYGRISHQSKPLLTHRVAYEMHYKKSPAGMLVCHKCDNPPCCNPHHLFLGTAQDNRQDCVSKGRHARGTCSKLTEDDVTAIYTADTAAWGAASLLSKKYNVSQVTICQIRTSRIWVHLTKNLVKGPSYERR